jgi:hypothetical protein
MSDDKQDRGPRDRERVNVNEPYEVRYWTRRFGCTESELRRAVAAVGVMARDVENYLKRHK